MIYWTDQLSFGLMNLLHFKCEAGASKVETNSHETDFKPLNLSSILDIPVVLFPSGKRKIMCDKIIEGLVTILTGNVGNLTKSLDCSCNQF